MMILFRHSCLCQSSIMTEEKKKKHPLPISDHPDCYFCPTSTPSSGVDLPETQNFFYSEINPEEEEEKGPLLHSSADPLLSQSAAKIDEKDVDECGIYPPDKIRHVSGEKNLSAYSNGLATTTLPLDIPSPLYCTSNRFGNLISAFDSLIHHLDITVSELTQKPRSTQDSWREKHLQELSSVLHRLDKLKGQSILQRKKFDKLMQRIVNDS